MRLRKETGFFTKFVGKNQGFRKKTRFLGAYASSQRNRVFYQIYGYKRSIFVKKPGFWEPMRLRKETGFFTKFVGKNQGFRKKTRFLGAYASSQRNRVFYQIYGYKRGIFVKKPGF